MEYQYGDFTEDGGFKIEDPDTPLPWANYLTNGDYCALISQHGGGFSFYVDPARHGVLRREMTGLRRDCPGRFFYIIDEKQQFAWSPNRVPMEVPLEDYSCTHKPGITTINSTYGEIETEINYFVPPDTDQEIWYLRLRNCSQGLRKLRVVAVSEWGMGNTAREATDRQWDQLFKNVKYNSEDEVLIGRKRHWESDIGEPREIKQWPYALYFTASRSPQSWDSRRDSFFGTYRGYHNPQALEKDCLACNEVEGSEAVGALDWKIELPAREEDSIACVLGVIDRDEVENKDWSLYQKNSYVNKALAKTENFWDERLSHVRVDLPDSDLQNLVNNWLPFQVTINTWFGRAPSFWHSSQGYTGFRDACHESFGSAPFASEDAREKIKHILSFTYESGLNSHRTPRGARDYDESDNADDPLWVPLALDAYLKETGDWDLLDEEVGFLESDEKTSIIEHMARGLDYVLTQRGKRGLPLIRYGDWNDALDTLGEEGEGESVWIGQFLCLALELGAEIMEKHDYRSDKADEFVREAENIREVINRECWDGEWYTRAFTDDDKPIGSSENEAGEIFLNTQTWAVIGDIASRERAEQAFSSVLDKLDTRWGFRYFAPAYEEIDPEIGVITQFSPGKKENGSIFSHAAAFSLVALAELGWGEEAYDLWKKISPTTHAREEADHYRLEPYVYCQNVTGPDSPDFGEGNYHWLSGTASWVYRAVLDHILGLKPEWEGLRIDPSLPPHWEEVEVERDFRGNRWTVEYHQPEGGNSEVEKILVNGEAVEDTLITLPDSEKAMHVEVYLE